MNIFKLIVILVSVILYANQAVSCESKWVEFVNNPSQDNYKKLKGNDSHQEGKGARSVSEDTQLKLINLIENKNKLAIDASFLLMPKLGGAALEEMFRAVGSVIIDEPIFVLEMFKKHNAPLHVVNSILTMVPYKLIEEYEIRTRLIDKRSEAINSVSNKQLQNTKEEALEILKDESSKMHKRLEMIKNMQ
jgi:hypothetical protein